MSVTLQPIPRSELQVLADSGLPDSVAARLAEAALPPRFVAQRSLAQLREGKDSYWCSTFYIVRDSDNLVVGGCGFKDAPSGGRVEIGYGVSPLCRNRGIATHAVRELLRLAFATDDVSEVLARINPANTPSSRVVQKLDFVKGPVIPDEDGEMVVQWAFRRPLGPSRLGPLVERMPGGGAQFKRQA